MRYLFDIGHPAEFHYFKHVMGELKKRGHDIVITARDKDVCLYLLADSGFEYINTGKNISSRVGKVFTLFRNDFKILAVARKFKPDLVVNFLSPFAAHAAKLLGKPVIGFHDTESAGVSVALAKPFTDLIVVPDYYTKRLSGTKEIRFKGYFGLNYLAPKYFSPDPSIKKLLGVSPEEKYMVLRFVSHRAIHDLGARGLSMETKRAAVKEFSKLAKVFISSEVELPADLKKFEIKVPPDRIHHALYHAGLIWGDSATMSAEGAVLGTPAVFVDKRGRGYTFELEKKYGLVFNFSDDAADQNRAIAKGKEILQRGIDHARWSKNRARLLSENIDSAAWMVWLIENYPESVKKIKNEPDLQHRFRL